jgi:hypothetical protein
MRFRWSLALFSLAAVALPAFPQAAPATVSVCDLLRNPQSFHRQTVRVRAPVRAEFEDFTLDHTDCGVPAIPGIWLTYAGDQYYEPARNLTLADDSRLADFKRFVFAQRTRRPDGKECYSRQCYFYVVTATFEGVFFAKSNPPERAYGHMGCCHLFVITKVDEVAPERTRVPGDGPYACLTRPQSIPSDQSKRLVSSDNGYAEFCNKLRDDLSRIFRDNPPGRPFNKADFDPGHVAQSEPYPDTWEWLSDDLLTIYTISLHSNPDRPGFVLTSLKLTTCARK